jgi:epoxyqueuosine reductase
MKACEKCAACMESCPTRAILPDRFLIQADRCLTWLNEREEPFPSWLEPQWHNAIIGCMHCQLACPVDKPHFLKVVDGPTFSEEETDLILSGISSDKLPEPTRAKLPNLGYGSPGWDVLLARNLRVLIDRAE